MLTRKCQAVVLAFLLVPFPAKGTTVVVFITQNGIAVSSDSKTVLRNSDYSSTGYINQAKFVIVQNRIVVAAIGVSDYRNGLQHYNFLTWMQGLQLSLPTNISVDDFTDLIERESGETFSKLGINSALSNGALQEKFFGEPCEIFAHFAIAGYQKGAPRLYEVAFDIDWNGKALVGPRKVLRYPADPSNYQIAKFGTQEALVDFMSRDSYAHKQALILCPKAITDIASSVYPSFDETVCLSRAFVQIEKNTNPDEVGGDIRTVAILPGGRAEEVTSTIFPKKKQTKNKN